MTPIESVATNPERYQRQALKYTHNAEDAQDVVQEALLHAWEKRDQFRGNAEYSTWFHSILYNTALMKLRRAKNRSAREVPLDLETEQELNVMAIGTAALEEQRNLEQLRRLLATLREPYGQTMRYRLMGSTVKEISRIMYVSESAVKSRLVRALGMLRECWQCGT
jgi:RNA polymerase sigma-70 factor, ECF subfamily